MVDLEPHPFGPGNRDDAESRKALLEALTRLDRLLQRAVEAVQAVFVERAADPYRGLYVSHEEAASFAAQTPGTPALYSPAHVERTAAEGEVEDRLSQLRRFAGLTALDLELLVVALAAELDLKYERIFSFLQDDVTRRRPTVDLALHLLCPSWDSRLEARMRLQASAPLQRYRILRLVEDPAHRDPPLLSRYLRPEPRVVDYLLGSDEIDPDLSSCATLVDPAAHLQDLELPDGLGDRLLQIVVNSGTPPVLYLYGPYGVGKRTTAEALCGQLGFRLLKVDIERMLAGGSGSFESMVPIVAREALLQEAILYWEGFDLLLGEDRAAERNTLLRWGGGPGLTILAGEERWRPAREARARSIYSVRLPRPEHRVRMRLWRSLLNGDGSRITDADVEALATKFRFSGGQIQDAVTAARGLARLRQPAGEVSADDLLAGCRLQSSQRLSSLARKIVPRYTWEDIVLPPDRMEQLREIRNTMQHRSLVYHQWGFDEKLSLGKGLNVLFAGPPGTGKTMAAEIIGRDLGLDLYKIDLASVVSKYIGETEKNLARVFTEAEASNAILFFDEADAMFGKRSEVRDSHDRYANLEISYLLQRMEEYEGVVILASNLRKNMDEAFVRRMHFAVDFPFPGERERRRIWEAIWPEGLPRHPNLGLEILARRLELAGGSIRNIAVAAAFLAAADGYVVSAEHLIRAVRREYQKMGKVVSEAEFEALVEA